MRRISALVRFYIASAALLLTTSCSAFFVSDQGRLLVGISVAPSSATARESVTNSVQFTAMGNFNMAPMTAATPVTWSIGPPGSTMPVPAGVSIDPMTGMARCSGFMGTVQIVATAPSSMSAPSSGMNMTSTNVTGSALLTCA